MLQPKAQPVQPLAAPTPSTPSAARALAQPFFGAMDALLADDRGEFTFDGAIRVSEASVIWRWLSRDIAGDLIDPGADPETGAAALSDKVQALVARAREASNAAAADPEAERRLRVLLGGSEVRQRLPVVLDVLRCLPLVPKARAFGRAVNGMKDEEAMTAALNALPRQDARAAAVVMMAALGEVSAPERLTIAATRLAGDSSELALERAGFGALIEAILAHAQNAIPSLGPAGAFADADLTCHAIERFHRLVRAVSGYVDLVPRARWSTVIAALTKTISDRLEPRLRDVAPAINRALRKGPADRLDGDDLLAALNNMYLLATVRDCRDSLALNEAFDESWMRSGQVLELHLTRSLEALRDDPADTNMAARVDTGIKMAEIRFGAEYADVLRRARLGLEKRLSA